MKKNPELRRYAKSKGVSMTQIADAMRVSVSTVSRWFGTDMHPSCYRLIVNTINRIAGTGDAGGTK